MNIFCFAGQFGKIEIYDIEELMKICHRQVIQPLYTIYCALYILH